MAIVRPCESPTVELYQCRKNEKHVGARVVRQARHRPSAITFTRDPRILAFLRNASIPSPLWVKIIAKGT